ncbi:hypothetical protein DSL72_007105 [Monilinia vaccinii-corymbosi]|uniref:Uncharacterized protein n=1 Tax=Monilinia vaccinii-corymbosi TaxID=61207 RepID=A0A8A3PLV3_9HELO|nr:hypothetical protein DSL72_007105 [Monilinia vaccinii-corymbosi]
MLTPNVCGGNGIWYQTFNGKRLLSSLHLVIMMNPLDALSLAGTFMCICSDATELSTELNIRLKNPKVTATGRRRKWQTLKQALKSVWSEKELIALMNRLALLRDSMQMHIVIDVRRDQLNLISSSQTSRFDSFDSSTQTIITALLKHDDEVRKSVQDQTAAITQVLGRMELLAETQTFSASIVRQVKKVEDHCKIVSRADGVFLWVKLVVGEILKGLENKDNLQDLQERIEIIPFDFEDLFSSMLGSIDPFYNRKPALIFLIVLAASVHGRSAKLLDTLSLSFALDYCANRGGNIRFDAQDLQMRNTKIRNLLKILYLHHSVREYLERPDIRQRFSKHIPGTDFEPYTALVWSYVKELETSEARRKILHENHRLNLFKTTVLHYSHKAELTGSDGYIKSLDAFETSTHDPRLKSTIWAPKDLSSFMHIAVNWGMEQMENSDSLRDRVPPSPRIVGLLLTHGAQPNRKMKDFSALREWTAFEMAIRNFCAILLPADTGEGSNHQYSDKEKSSVSKHLEIIIVMLDDGADPNTPLNYQGGTIMPRTLLIETMRKSWRSKEIVVDQIFAKNGGKLKLSTVRKWMLAG